MNQPGDKNIQKTLFIAICVYKNHREVHTQCNQLWQQHVSVSRQFGNQTGEQQGEITHSELMFTVGM